MTNDSFPRGPSALVIAHPGHGLRVHGWLEAARPIVFVLTDGSGHTGRSRLASTSALLRRAGGRPGPVYGRLTDPALYQAILDGSHHVFRALAEEIGQALAGEDVAAVVGDAAEGYNPGHDACRLIANAAVAMASRRLGRRIANFDFSLTGAWDGARAEDLPPGSVRIRLDEDAFARKLDAARAYTELAVEVEAALAEKGASVFRTEWLRRLPDPPPAYRFDGDPPDYERHGEERVTAGYYARVLRYREHMLPLAQALAQTQAAPAAVS